MGLEFPHFGRIRSRIEILTTYIFSVENMGLPFLAPDFLALNAADKMNGSWL